MWTREVWKSLWTLGCLDMYKDAHVARGKLQMYFVLFLSVSLLDLGFTCTVNNNVYNGRKRAAMYPW